MTPFVCDVDIALDTAIDLPGDYIEKHRLLSSKERIVHVLFQNKKIYSATVPKNTFNPYKGVAANKLIEWVFKKNAFICGKRVVDLGCGSGVIGLACIHQGASSVLFTDINPSVSSALHSHPMLRTTDRVKVQDLLNEEEPSSYDLILTSTPTNVVSADTVIDSSTYEGALFRTDQFLYNLIAESARCLVPGGTLAMWVKLAHPFRGSHPPQEFLMELSRYFELCTMKLFWRALESEVNVGKQDGRVERSHLVFTVQKPF